MIQSSCTLPTDNNANQIIPHAILNTAEPPSSTYTLLLYPSTSAEEEEEEDLPPLDDDVPNPANKLINVP